MVRFTDVFRANNSQGNKFFNVDDQQHTKGRLTGPVIPSVAIYRVAVSQILTLSTRPPEYDFFPHGSPEYELRPHWSQRLKDCAQLAGMLANSNDAVTLRILPRPTHDGGSGQRQRFISKCR